MMFTLKDLQKCCTILFSIVPENIKKLFYVFSGYRKEVFINYLETLQIRVKMSIFSSNTAKSLETNSFNLHLVGFLQSLINAIHWRHSQELYKRLRMRALQQ